MSERFVYDFAEGNAQMRDLLGGKGAGLAEMTRLGLPVPPGFTITTEACRHYLSTGKTPGGLDEETEQALERLQDKVGRRFGDPAHPLLVSVRSGAAFSMPGMMETVLDIGLNDETVGALAQETGDERFAWDSYRRLIAMFGSTVMGIDSHRFEGALQQVKDAHSAATDLDLDAAALRDLVDLEKAVVRDEAGREFPQDPRDQVHDAIRAVFQSWLSPRARLYRRQERIPEDLGTAVSVVTMVFGNLGMTSGTGVAFTRDPSTGRRGIYGDYLQDAQGEDVVAGIRNTVPLAELESIDAAAYAELMRCMSVLESHYRDLCDIEFTIERGKLWLLQTRVGKRTAAAAFRIATELVGEGVIDMDEALLRVDGRQLANLMFPRFARTDAPVLAKGVDASPGAAVGAVVFDCPTAVREAAEGRNVILVRPETTPDDLDGMIAAVGILTSRGGRTSHAAVVARGMGKTCVTGAEDVIIDRGAGSFHTPDGNVVRAGDVLSVDGTTGKVYLGELPVVDPPVVDYLEGRVDPATAGDDIVRAVHRLLEHADRVRRLGVRANADLPPDAERARRYGAEGIGLCRTEHMFLGERRLLVERMVLADTDAERDAALDDLEVLQRSDFEELLRAMDGLPVTVRLIDPPLHEFLPDLTDLSVKVALDEASGTADADDVRLLKAVRRLHEANPMLGLRGVRLGIVVPGLIRMQTRALAEAAASLLSDGGSVDIEIMVPLVGAVQELELARADCLDVLHQVEQASGVTIPAQIGTMIELPRAALTAGQIATAAEFFSFGTNDLTQMTWGFSRDDVERSVVPAYLDHGIFGVSPFEEIDRDGVGRLVRLAVQEGRETRASLRVGVCGEHGGNPASIAFFHDVGLDYVSCSPFRVPVARLEAGRAALQEKSGGAGYGTR